MSLRKDGHWKIARWSKLKMSYERAMPHYWAEKLNLLQDKKIARTF